MNCRSLILTAVLVALCASLHAADRVVKDSAGLAAALKSAAAGDRILLAPGDYTLAATLTVGPLTIQSQDKANPAVISPAPEAAFALDCGNVEGVILLRTLVFDGGGKDVGALQTLGTRLEVEDCEFRDFSGKRMIYSGSTADSRRKLRGLRLSRCTFRTNPKGAALRSIGPALVEDCTFENVSRGIDFQDWSGKNAQNCRYKVVIRRNEFCRTEGTPWACHAITTRTTAPEIHDNFVHDISSDKQSTNALEIASNGLDAIGIPTAAQVYRNVIVDRVKAADSGWLHEGIEYGEYRPTQGRIYENVIACRGPGGVRPSYYNKGDRNEWFNNVLYCVSDSHGQFFHCYGLDCRYYNNVQAGGTASMLNADDVKVWAEKKWLDDTCTSQDYSMQRSCCWQVQKNSFHQGEGYFEADPKFVDPDRMDFHLRFDSPCINKGTGSRDGLTPTDLGAFEYPIQVCAFTVDAKGETSWRWANGFQKVSKRVRIRWNARKFPESANAEGDETVAEVDAKETHASTGKTSGYFAAFVLDTKDRWSGPTPDGVHRAKLP